VEWSWKRQEELRLHDRYWHDISKRMQLRLLVRLSIYRLHHNRMLGLYSLLLLLLLLLSLCLKVLHLHQETKMSPSGKVNLLKIMISEKMTMTGIS